MRLKFEMFRRFDQQGNGVFCTFTDGKGRDTTTFFPSPPTNIQGADITYLQGRFPNIRNEHHVTFIKKRFSEEINKFTDNNYFSSQEVQPVAYHHQSDGSIVLTGKVDDREVYFPLSEEDVRVMYEQLPSSKKVSMV